MGGRRFGERLQDAVAIGSVIGDQVSRVAAFAFPRYQKTWSFLSRGGGGGCWNEAGVTAVVECSPSRWWRSSRDILSFAPATPSFSTVPLISSRSTGPSVSWRLHLDIGLGFSRRDEARQVDSWERLHAFALWKQGMGTWRCIQIHMLDEAWRGQRHPAPLMPRPARQRSGSG